MLKSADIFVMASRGEGLPNAVMEAVAAGVPVVATRVGGLPELIEGGVSGLLVAPQDPPSLADAILKLLQDSGVAARLACSGRGCIHSSFSFDRVLGEFESMYEAQYG